MTMKHTPGPWESMLRTGTIHHDTDIVIDRIENGRAVENVCSVPAASESDAQAAADAALICAAPELLSIAERLNVLVCLSAATDPKCAAWAPLVEEANAIIKKAKGIA